MKETKELLVGLIVIGKLVADVAKDGVGLDDVSKLVKAFEDPVTKAKVQAAAAGIDKIGEEFKDFGLAKALELLQVLPELVSALGVLEVKKA